VFNLAKKLGAVALAAGLVAGVVTPGMAAHSRASVNLLIYTHLQDSEVPVIQSLAKGWEAKTGNTVKVVNDKSSFQSFTTLARTGKGPDVMFGLAHDNMGTFQLAGLVAPVPAGVWNPKDYAPLATPAVNFGGKAYSVPLVVETTTLNYNRRLIKSPPKTWDEVIKQAKMFGNHKGSSWGILWDISNYYFSYGLISGLGGYTFNFKNGAFDSNDIGLNNAGAVAALTLFRDLVQKDKLIPSDITYGTAQSLFQKGQVGMFIDGSWDIAANKKALGADYGVTLLPTLAGGKQPHPYAGVQVAFVNAFSKNQPVAWDFIKYMAPIFGVPDWKVSGRFPATRAGLDDPAIQKDPITAAFAKQLQLATPMPNIAEMNSVWTPAGNAIKLVITGKATPQAAADAMVKQIKQGIAQIKQ